MIGLSSRIVVEKREDGNLLAAYEPLNDVSFPANIFSAATGASPLVSFHKALGDVLAQMTNEQRSRAHASVELDDEGHPFLRFGYYRIETEDEYASRIAAEKEKKSQYEAVHNARRRQLYEDLKREFEGDEVSNRISE